MAKNSAKITVLYNPGISVTPQGRFDGIWVTASEPHQVVRIWRHDYERPPVNSEPRGVGGYCEKVAKECFSFKPSDDVECVYTPVAEPSVPTRFDEMKRETLFTVLTGRDINGDYRSPPQVVSLDNMELLNSWRGNGATDGAETAYLMVQRFRRFYSGDRARADYQPLFEGVDRAFLSGNLKDFREALQQLVNGIR